MTRPWTPSKARGICGQIREARLSDATGIVELERHFPSDRMSLQSVRRLLRSASAIVLVAVETRRSAAASRILGALVLLLRKSSGLARIYSIVIDEDARGQGLAQRLLRRAEAAATAAGRQAVTLEVRGDNAAARNLYARAGYAEVRGLPGFYEDGADGVRLQKRLRNKATIATGARRAPRKTSGVQG